MSEMVERLTTIIQEMVEVRRWSIKPEDNLNYRRAYEPIARAAIEAMREPTDGISAISFCSDLASNLWPKMIDEALK